MKEDLIKFRRSKNFAYYLVSFAVNGSIVAGTLLAWLSYILLPFSSREFLKFQQSQGFLFVNESIGMLLFSLLGVITFSFWFADKATKFVTKLAKLKWVNEE